MFCWGRVPCFASKGVVKEPLAVSLGNEVVIKIAAGGDRSFATVSSGQLYTWGESEVHTVAFPPFHKSAALLVASGQKVWASLAAANKRKLAPTPV